MEKNDEYVQSQKYPGNKKVADVTPAEWTQILTLTQNGVQKTDKVFAMRSAETNTVLAGGETGWTPWRILSNTWEFLSERWVQEFKAEMQGIHVMLYNVPPLS